MDRREAAEFLATLLAGDVWSPPGPAGAGPDPTTRSSAAIERALGDVEDHEVDAVADVAARLLRGEPTASRQPGAPPILAVLHALPWRHQLWFHDEGEHAHWALPAFGVHLFVLREGGPTWFVRPWSGRWEERLETGVVRRGELRQGLFEVFEDLDADGRRVRVSATGERHTFPRCRCLDRGGALR